MGNKIDQFFKVTERGSSFKKEIVGGITGFLSIAYIMAVIPLILGDAGMPVDAVFTAGIVIAIIATLAAALYANYPVIIISSIGTNVLIAYGMQGVPGYNWQLGMAAIVVAGTLFFLLTISGFREKVVAAVPRDLQFATISGIGFFIAFIGLQDSGIIVDGPNLVSFGNVMTREFAVVVFGIVVLTFFTIKGVYYGIIATLALSTIFGIILGVVEMPASIVSTPPSMAPVAFKSVDYIKFLLQPEMLILIFSVLFTNFFDSLGTLMAVGVKSGLVKEGDASGARKVMMVDAGTSAIGGLLGAGSTTTALESLTSISSGARTGLSSVVAASLFAASLFLAPLVGALNTYITSPVLIILGASMCTSMLNIQFDKMEYAIPAFFIIILMPLAFSIPIGLAAGFIMYTVAMIAKGKHKDVSLLIYFLDIVFIIYFMIA